MGEHDLTLSLPAEPVETEADPLRLEQIVSNLLSNASKFTPQGGHIRLTVEPVNSTGEIVIRVRDDGIGIPPEALPRLFDLFMQVDSSLNRTTGGLGIGLSLVQHLVELHGGRVEAHSDGLGRGSEFVVHLPAASAAGSTARQAPGPERAEPDAVTRRVLVADDNIDGAEALAIVLRLSGHDVRIAHSGQEAVAIATVFRPDVVFLDIGMPGMDGYEAAQLLRRVAGLERTLLVAVTGFGQESARRWAQDAGFDEFVVKPVFPNIVRVIVQKTRASGPAPSPES